MWNSMVGHYCFSWGKSSIAKQNLITSIDLKTHKRKNHKMINKKQKRLLVYSQLNNQNQSNSFRQRTTRQTSAHTHGRENLHIHRSGFMDFGMESTGCIIYSLNNDYLQRVKQGEKKILWDWIRLMLDDPENCSRSMIALIWKSFRMWRDCIVSLIGS